MQTEAFGNAHVDRHFAETTAELPDCSPTLLMHKFGIQGPENAHALTTFAPNRTGSRSPLRTA